MTRLVIELDEGRGRKLQDLAVRSRRTEADLCREAIDRLLLEREATATTAEGLEALRRLIGLVPDGPTHSAQQHDWTPGDEP